MGEAEHWKAMFEGESRDHARSREELAEWRERFYRAFDAFLFACVIVVAMAFYMAAGRD